MRSAATILFGLVAMPALAVDCSAPADETPLTTDLAASAAGLDGGPAAPLPTVFDSDAGDLAVAAVLARIREQRCSTVAAADGYQKQTEFDNTPYRFNMRPGQKMNAAEFDAWMESRGIRIVRARDETAPAANSAPIVAE